MKTKYVIYSADDSEKRDVHGLRGVLTRLLVDAAFRIAPMSQREKQWNIKLIYHEPTIDDYAGIS